MNNKIRKILNKKDKSKIICLTAYSGFLSKILDKYIDIILVGDSLGNVLYGMKNTHKVTLDMMINHGKSVKQGIEKSLLVVDMPFNTYKNKKEALQNAKKIIKKTGCDAVKVESNYKNSNIIKFLVKSKIPVMGHIGHTPQFKKKFKVEGMTHKAQKKLLLDAKKIQEAGAFGIILECIQKESAKSISTTLNIPTIGIGSSQHCDGQILVTEDLLGLSGFYPKFVKKYANLHKLIDKAVKKYSKEVRKNIFPKNKNSY